MRRQRRMQRWVACLLAVLLVLSSGLSGLAEELTDAAEAERYELLTEEIMRQAGAEPTDEPIEATEEPAATETPAVSETPEETALPEATETPAVSETPEATVSPEATEEPTPEPAPEPTPGDAEPEATAEGAPTAEPTETPEENTHFSAGYVRMTKGRAIYARVGGEALGTLAADAIVYAELSQQAEQPEDDWLKVTFDTQALRESDAEFAEGYVLYSKVEALTEEEAEQLAVDYAQDGATRWNGKFYVPCVAFEEPEGSDDAPAGETPTEGESAASQIIGVWYDKGIEERPLQIHVTTSLDAQVLYLYQGDDLLSSWQASEAQIDEYAACKEWHVSYTFDYSGEYYLWYRASADGTAMSAAYAPDPVRIERPALIDVWYERASKASR